MYEFLNKNDLLTPKQSDFRPGDSIINQLLSITNEIHTYIALDEYPSRETHAIFLDIFKVFDKASHEGLIFELTSNGVSGKLLDLIKSFLSKHNQSVVLNDKSSSQEAGFSRCATRVCAWPIIFLFT